MAAISSPAVVPPGSSSDASSLRAAALKTLKMGKRRRPVPGQTPTPLARPVPQDILQLDYGQDDTTSELPQALHRSPSPVAGPVHSVLSPPRPVHEADVDMREEGEISDEDTSPGEASSLQPLVDQTNGVTKSVQNGYPSGSKSPVPQLLTRLSMPQSPQSPAAYSTASSVPYTGRGRSVPVSDNQVSTNASAPYFSHTSRRERSPIIREPILSPDMSNGYVPSYDPTGYTMDRHEIRPGLFMTQMEYDAAKDIVLDLLGWGVPPQYLVSCGLSKELVFYVFTDLRLRLPPNLNMHDLSHDGDALVSASPSHDDNLIGNQLASRIGNIVDDMQALGRSSVSPGVGAHSTPFTATSVAVVAPTPEELEDMERQRREELLARKKAALASRKAKHSMDGSPTAVQNSGGSDVDMEMGPPAPSETVENFLKSISPNNQGEFVPPSDQMPIESSAAVSDSAETDEIPGLDSSRSGFTTIPSPTPSQYLTPPSSADSVTAPSAQVRLPPESAFSLPSRTRSTRRPVASDFVDVEDARSPSNFDPSNGVKRKPHSGMNFANITNMRRCIIDLSDSEGDDDPADSSEGIKRPHTVSNPRILYNFNNSRIPISTPTPFASAKTRSTTVTPSPEASALELRILKMREEIAQLEQNMKRKALAKMNHSSMNNTPGSSTPSPDDAPQQSALKEYATDLLVEPMDQPINTFDHGQFSNEEISISIPDNGDYLASSIGSQLPMTAVRTRPRSRCLKVQPVPEAMDLDDVILSSTTHGADTALTLSARISQDIYEHPFEPQSSLDTSPTPLDRSFWPYQSTLLSYPLLRAQMTPPRLTPAEPFLSDSAFPLTQENNTLNSALTPDTHAQLPSLVLPDLQPLKLATIMKHLDPSKQLCQYEVPGGGVCRDEGCNDVHLSRLPMDIDGEALEPTDQETANFLLGAMPLEWQSRNNVTVGKMIAALTLVRQSSSLMTLSFEERVGRALLVLEPPPPVPK